MLNTTLCYLEQDGCWLMLHRVKKKNDPNHDKWIGVGGKCEEGESPEDCVQREVFEETGLTLLDARYRGLVTFVLSPYPTEYMHLFTATRWQGTLVPGDVCSEGVLEWVEKARVQSLPIWPGDKLFFRLLEEERPFFSLKLVYENGERLTKAVLDGKPMALEGEDIQPG